MDYPCRAIQQSAFLCHFVIVNRFNYFVGESFLYNLHGLFIFLSSENRQNYQIVYFQVIHVYSYGTIWMFGVLMSVIKGTSMYSKPNFSITFCILSRQYLYSSASLFPSIVFRFTNRTIPSACPVMSPFCAGIMIISHSKSLLSSLTSSYLFQSGFSEKILSEIIARLSQIRTLPPSRLMSEN